MRRNRTTTVYEQSDHDLHLMCSRALLWAEFFKRLFAAGLSGFLPLSRTVLIDFECPNTKHRFEHELLSPQYLRRVMRRGYREPSSEPPPFSLFYLNILTEY